MTHYLLTMAVETGVLAGVMALIDRTVTHTSRGQEK